MIDLSPRDSKQQKETRERKIENFVCGNGNFQALLVIQSGGKQMRL